MVTDEYTQKNAVEFSGMEFRKLVFYSDQGVIGFTKKAEGRGHKRFYTKANLLEAKVAGILNNNGMTMSAIKAVFAYLNEPPLAYFENYRRYLQGRLYIFISYDLGTGKLNIRAKVKGGHVDGEDCVLTVKNCDHFPHYCVLNFTHFAEMVESY